jgi:DNA or RNA helicases of superfamily II
VTEIKLRPYQEELLARIRDARDAGHHRILAVLPTGGGKTICFSALIREALDASRRALLLAPRRELVHQAANTLSRLGIHSGVIMAGEPRHVMQPCQVASVDTLRARFGRKGADVLPRADLVVVDEAHTFDTKPGSD